MFDFDDTDFHSEHRPVCPNCGLDLVFVAIAIGDKVVEAWLCDCGKQIEAVRHVVNLAREDSDESAGVLVFNPPF